MNTFASIFKNGGTNFSFGRVFAGLVIFVGMVTMTLAIGFDYNHGVKPVQMSRYNTQTQTAYVETILVAEPNWSGYQSFMIGLVTLAGGVYGLSKFGDAATQYAKNVGSNEPGAIS